MEIVDDLKLSADTIKVDVKRTLRKLNARNRAHAVQRGFDLGSLERWTSGDAAGVPAFRNTSNTNNATT